MTLELRKRQYLAAMGIQTWLRRDAVNPEVNTLVDSSQSNVLHAGIQASVAMPKQNMARQNCENDIGKENDQLNTSGMNWLQLRSSVQSCNACELSKMRTQAVFGVGDEQANWMIIGEAPGADEDRQGEPFVGRAGLLLNNMLLAIGLKREQVFIANILKCRPPNNRDPLPQEVGQCEAYLHRQVALIQPKLILAVGRIAAQNLLKTDTPIGKLRGQTYQYGETRVPLVVTYHPAYLLRSPKEKRKAWQDLRLAQQVYSDASRIRGELA